MKKAASSQGHVPFELDEQQLSHVVGGSGEDGWDLTDISPLAWPRIRIADLEVKLNPVVVQKALIR